LSDKLVYAAQSARLFDKDQLSYAVVQAEPWAADDPLVTANPDAFTDYPVTVKRTVLPTIEQATAAPGEKRSYVHRTPREEPAPPKPRW
jgi:hypothetical protein